MHGYKINSSLNKFKQIVLDAISRNQTGNGDFCILFLRNKPDSEPIYFICLDDINPPDVISQMTQSDFELVGTKAYDSWGFFCKSLLK